MDSAALTALGPRKPYDEAVAGWNDLSLLQRAQIESIAAIEWWRGYHARATTERNPPNLYTPCKGMAR